MNPIAHQYAYIETEIRKHPAQSTRQCLPAQLELIREFWSRHDLDNQLRAGNQLQNHGGQGGHHVRVDHNTIERFLAMNSIPGADIEPHPAYPSAPSTVLEHREPVVAKP